MDKRLKEIANLLALARDMILARNAEVGYEGNPIINVHIDKDRVDILMSNAVKTDKKRVLVAGPRESAADENKDCCIYETEVDGVIFSDVELFEREADKNAKVAV